jgi:purine-binding chemotaxis protein CheW
MDDLNNNVSNSYLTFKIGTELFGASVKNVINILEMAKITPVPKAPNYMKGVLNLRGSVLPVLDTRIKLGLDHIADTVHTCILVMEVGVNNDLFRMGAIVDSVQEVLELTENEIQDPPKIGANYQSDLVIGMAKKEDQFIMILDISKLFGQESILDSKDMKKEIYPI